MTGLFKKRFFWASHSPAHKTGVEIRSALGRGNAVLSLAPKREPQIQGQGACMTRHQLFSRFRSPLSSTVVQQLKLVDHGSLNLQEAEIMRWKE